MATVPQGTGRCIISKNSVQWAIVYAMLMCLATETLQTIAADPEWLVARLVEADRVQTGILPAGPCSIAGVPTAHARRYRAGLRPGRPTLL